MGHIHHRHVHQHQAGDVEKRQADEYWPEEHGMATVMNVVYVTATKTFDGDASYITPGNPVATQDSVATQDINAAGSMILLPPVQNTRTSTPVELNTQVPVQISTSSKHTELDPTPVSTQVSSTSTTKETPTPSPTTTSQESSTKVKPTRTTTKHVKTTSVKTHQHTTMVKSTSSKATSKAPKSTASKDIVNAAKVHENAASTSQVTSSSATAAITGSTTDNSGMSGGAIAGLAIGLLLGLAAIIAAVFLVYRRKKKSEGMQKLDDEKSYNEKTPIPAPAPTAAASIRTARSHETAPRLSLRAVSQFSPTFQGDNGKGGKPEMTQNGMLAAPGSAWERPGAQNAQNDPANPFGSHAEKSVSPEPTRPEPPRQLKTDSFAIVGGKVPDSGRVTPPEHQQPPQSPTAPSIRSVSSGASGASGFTEASEAPSAIVGGASAGAPGGPAPPPSNVHRVQMDFQPTMDDELGVRAGQLIRILHNYDDGWALCIRMDRSQQGVVPRSCLSKHPLKPRQPNRPRGPPPGVRGPPPPFAAQPRPLSPGGRNSPGPNGRPMSPASGRGSPAPFAGPGPRPASPLRGPPRGPPRGPGPRPRAGTTGGPPRSMSPGPYGPGAQRPEQPAMRRRSNSVGDLSQRRQSPPSGPSPLNPNGGMPVRKPVPGQAM